LDREWEFHELSVGSIVRAKRCSFDKLQGKNGVLSAGAQPPFSTQFCKNHVSVPEGVSSAGRAEPGRIAQGRCSLLVFLAESDLDCTDAPEVLAKDPSLALQASG
jgi:hypothetical protein